MVAHEDQLQAARARDLSEASPLSGMPEQHVVPESEMNLHEPSPQCACRPILLHSDPVTGSAMFVHRARSALS